MRHRLVTALCLLTASSSPALAQEAGRPVPPEHRVPITPLHAPAPAPAAAPRLVEVVSGHAAVAAQVEARSVQLASCTPRTRATFVRTRVKLGWNARGAVRSVAVSGPGGATFTRCVSSALRGALVAPPARAGSGSAVVIVRRAVARTPQPIVTTPAPKPAPKPAPIVTKPAKPAPKPAPPPATGKAALQRCTVDADCTIHFQTDACFPGDPIAVNKRDMAAVRAAFPVRHLACGMGGPQYMEQRMANEGRYSAACEASRCVVRDAGPRPGKLGL